MEKDEKKMALKMALNRKVSGEHLRDGDERRSRRRRRRRGPAREHAARCAPEDPFAGAAREPPEAGVRGQVPVARGLLADVRKAILASSASIVPKGVGFRLHTAFPAQPLTDDTRTLESLGLVP